MFDDLYKKLNKAQKLAVDTIDGPVMVVAGPGTGKTQILTLRIANILKQTQVGPENILALTFTEAGAKEMRRRLRTIIGNTADKVRIHTYHGFAASVIAEHNDHFPHLAGTKQLTETEAEVFIREILEEPDLARLRPLGNPDFYIPKIISTIGTAKKEAWTPEIIKSFAKTEIDRIRNDDSSISSRGARKGALKADALKQIDKCERTVLFADVYQKYEAKKKVKRKVDFDDLIGELLLALERDELLRQILQEKFQYLLIDEHQDTNDSQNMLVKIIADFFDEPNLFVVGDEKQAIYRFQGASVENFIKFQGIWNP